MEPTKHTPGGHNLDILHLGGCTTCGGTHLIDCPNEPAETIVASIPSPGLLKALKALVARLDNSGLLVNSIEFHYAKSVIAKAEGGKP